mgnify:FL=1
MIRIRSILYEAVSFIFQGKGIASAHISVDGRVVARTDSQGKYTVEGMKAGEYVFSVSAQSVFFDDVRVKISAGDPQLPVISADRCVYTLYCTIDLTVP